MPHPDKEETGGEDAHFICDEQAIGVADGVGGWADLGVDAGQYARELMSHSLVAIQEEPKGSIDPVRVLEKAYMSTKAKGSSTACIIALTDKVCSFLSFMYCFAGYCAPMVSFFDIISFRHFISFTCRIFQIASLNLLLPHQAMTPRLQTIIAYAVSPASPCLSE